MSESETKRMYALEDLRGKTPEELQEIINGVKSQIRELHQDDNGELRELSDPEKKAMKVLLDVHDRAIEMYEEHRAIQEVLRKRPKSIEHTRLGGAPDDPYADVRRLSIPEARERALRVLDDKNATRHLQPDQLDQLDRTVRKDSDIARRILVTENDDYRTAWQKLVTQPDGAIYLTEEERQAVRSWNEFRNMSENVSASGGYGIPVFIDPSIIMTAQGSGNPFLQIARQVPVTTNIWKGVSSAGVSWSFDTEGAAVSDDSPTLAQPSVTVHMARGYIPFSIELGQDYPGFAEEMAGLLGEGYDELLISKFSTGSGTGEPQGVITGLDATAASEVLLTTAGAFGEIDLYNVWKALPQRFRNPRAAWMMSVGINNAIRRFGTAQVYHASTIDLQQEWVDRLMNRQVHESAYFPDVVATTGHVNQLVVGDFSGYLIARRGGMSVELLPLVVDVTANRPTGERGWFAYARIGGGVVNSAALRILNQT